MEDVYFHPEHIKEYQENPLTQGEILKGNKTLLRFMGYEHDKSDKWILECARFDHSWEELLKVALKIFSFWDNECSSMNGKRFNYKHLMFHQILNFNYLYRRSVEFAEEYFKFLDSKQ